MTIKTPLKKEDFNEILNNYNIGEYKSSKYIFTGDNTIYKIKTTKGEYLLKIYEKASLKFVKYQISLMEFFTKTKVSTPRIINTKTNKGLFIYNGKRIVIQEFVKGKEIQYANEKLARDMGDKYGFLDKTLFIYKKRVDIGVNDIQYKLIKWNINSSPGLDFKKESRLLLNEIRKLNKNKLRKSLIHGDLCEGNFLVSNNKVSAIIDWDDAREDFLAYEIAIPIAHNFITLNSVRKKFIKIFLREYQKHIKLNSEEKKALYYFIKHRELSASTWCYDQIKKHPDRKKELAKWFGICVKKYKAFNKISLEDFLELVK